MIGATIETFGRYLEDCDWMTRENANTQRSVNGLNNYVREAFAKAYGLPEFNPAEVREAHESGEAHIHDFGFCIEHEARLEARETRDPDSFVQQVFLTRDGGIRLSESDGAHFAPKQSSEPSCNVM